MPSRLSSLLVRDGLVGVRRMEKAFQRQVIYGGSLDTILLELGMVPEERLCQYLALASGLPPASRAEQEQIDPAAVALLPLEAAQSYRALPLVLEGEAVRMAVCSPIDLEALEDLADRVDRPLRPLLVPEYRWHLMMARAYGSSVPQRYAALAAQIEKEPVATPVGRARTIIVENEPERDTIVAAQPVLSAAPVPVAGDETARARANRVTEDVLPSSSSRSRTTSRPPSNSEAREARMRPPTAPGTGERAAAERIDEDDRTEPGPPDPFGMEREIARAKELSAAVRPAEHENTPKSKRRRGGVTLIGVSPVRALSELGPQSDLLGETDLSPASGIPTHVRGELGDDDVTPPPPPPRHGDSGRRMTEAQFPALSTTASAPITPPGMLVAIAPAAKQGDVEDAGAAPLPPTPATPARSRTAQMQALTGAAGEGSGPRKTAELAIQAPPPSAAPVEPAAQPSRYLQTIPPPLLRASAPHLQAPRATSGPERLHTEQPVEQRTLTRYGTPPLVPETYEAEDEVAVAPRPATAPHVEPRTSTRPGTTPPAQAARPATAPPEQATPPAPHFETTLDSLRSEPSFLPPVASALTPNVGPISQRDARELLVYAEHRDDVFLALLRAVRHTAQWAGLLTIQGGVAIGRLALAHPELDTEQISTVLIPLDAPSPIRTAVNSKRMYVGPLAKGDPAVDSMFLRLGGIRPPSLAVLPLVLRERVVAMVVAHRADRDITFGDVADLLPLAQLATDAIGRLILRSKGDSTKTTAPPRAVTTPPQDASFGARARTEPPPSGAAPHRAPGQRGEQSRPVKRTPDPDDPDPEPAPLQPAPTSRRPTRPVLELISDDPDDPDNHSAVGRAVEIDVVPDDERDVPEDWRGTAAEDKRERGGYGFGHERLHPDEPWSPTSPRPTQRFPSGVPTPLASRATEPPATAAGTAKQQVAGERLPASEATAARSAKLLQPVGTGIMPAPQQQHGALPRPSPRPSPPPSSALSSGSAPMALPPEVLLELIEERGAEMEPAIDEAIARAAEVLPLLAQRFPGELAVERYQTSGRPLRAAQYGGLLELVTRMGAGGGELLTSLLVEKLGATSRDVRFYAAVCLLELRPRRAIMALFERLFDPDFGVRTCAIEALQGYPTRELDAGIARLRQALHSDDAGRVAAAAQAVAELDDRDALVDLISAMGRGERFAEASRRALMSLTKQDFGTNDRRWHKWWDDHRRRHRVEWLIDGLQHKESELRTAAIADLRRLTGESFGYEPEAAKRDRDIAHRRWLTWWSEAGRLRFVAQENERHRPTALLPMRHDPGDED